MEDTVTEQTTTPADQAKADVTAAFRSAGGDAKAPIAKPKASRAGKSPRKAAATKATVKKAAAKKAPAKKAPAKRVAAKKAPAYKPPSNPELESQLKVVEDYANQVAKADRTADTDTLAVGEAIDTLYRNTEWVHEYDNVKPAKANAAGRVDASSRRRFAEWLAWRADLRGRSAPKATYCWRLLTAYQTASRVDSGNAVKPATEGQIRPLNWLVKHGHEDKVNAVWSRAVGLAEADRRKSPNVADVSAALKDYKATLPKETRQRITTAAKVETATAKAKAAIEALWAVAKLEGAPDDVTTTFHTWYRAWASAEH